MSINEFTSPNKQRGFKVSIILEILKNIWGVRVELEEIDLKKKNFVEIDKTTLSRILDHPIIISDQEVRYIDQKSIIQKINDLISLNSHVNIPEGIDIEQYQSSINKRINKFLETLFNNLVINIDNFDPQRNQKEILEICNDIDRFNEEMIVKEEFLKIYIKHLTPEEKQTLRLEELHNIDIKSYKCSKIPEKYIEKIKEILHKSFPYSTKKVDNFIQDENSKIHILMMGSEILAVTGLIGTDQCTKLINWFGVNSEKSIHGVSTSSFFESLLTTEKQKYNLICNTRYWVKSSAKKASEAGGYSNKFSGKGFGNDNSFQSNSYIEWSLNNKDTEFKAKNLEQKYEEDIIRKIVNSNKFYTFSEGSFIGIKSNISGYNYHSDKRDENTCYLIEEKYKEGYYTTNILYKNANVYFLLEKLNTEP